MRDQDLSVFVDALDGAWMDPVTRLQELKDEREALRLRLGWANSVLMKWQNSRARRARDFYASRICDLNRDIEDLEKEMS